MLICHKTSPVSESRPRTVIFKECLLKFCTKKSLGNEVKVDTWSLGNEVKAYETLPNLHIFMVSLFMY